jgi:N-acyl-D-aspartate/D-glutamate deacylase
MYAGMKISDFSLDCASDVIEILSHNSNTTLAAFSGMSKENMLRIISHPACMAGSDGNALPQDLKFGGCHPRSFGAIPHFIKLLLEQGVSIEEAVYKCTYLPAKIFNLKDCGLLYPGAKADIVIFNPEEIDGTENFASPNTVATGIVEVISNGIRVL